MLNSVIVIMDPETTRDPEHETEEDADSDPEPDATNVEEDSALSATTSCGGVHPSVGETGHSFVFTIAPDRKSVV